MSVPISLPPPSPLQGRANSRSARTRVALLEAAELLIGESGFDGVSMRQIGQVIGSANINVVAYHFGNKEDLVLAVLRYRLPTIEGRRAELLARAGHPLDQLCVLALADIMFRPFLEQANAQGRHSYILFLAGLIRAGRINLRVALSAEFLVSQAVHQRLRLCVPEGAARFFDQRMQMATQVMATGMQIADERGASATAAEEIYADTLRSIVGLLLAPAD